MPRFFKVDLHKIYRGKKIKLRQTEIAHETYLLRTQTSPRPHNLEAASEGGTKTTSNSVPRPTSSLAVMVNRETGHTNVFRVNSSGTKST